MRGVALLVAAAVAVGFCGAADVSETSLFVPASSTLTTGQFFPVDCVPPADGATLFDGCSPLTTSVGCGRYVEDDFATKDEVSELLEMSHLGMSRSQLAPEEGGPTILDVNSGFLRDKTLQNIYRPRRDNSERVVAEAVAFKPSQLQLYGSVFERIHAKLITVFNLTSLYFTAPTFVARLKGSPDWTPTSEHDEYYHPHADGLNTEHYHYSGLLYLTNHGPAQAGDFEGGLFRFYEGLPPADEMGDEGTADSTAEIVAHGKTIDQLPLAQADADDADADSDDGQPRRGISGSRGGVRSGPAPLGSGDVVVEPKAGRLVLFTSGSENWHRVERVAAGERLTFSMWFTCSPRHEFARFLDGKAHVSFKSKAAAAGGRGGARIVEPDSGAGAGAAAASPASAGSTAEAEADLPATERPGKSPLQFVREADFHASPPLHKTAPADAPEYVRAARESKAAAVEADALARSAARGSLLHGSQGKGKPGPGMGPGPGRKEADGHGYGKGKMNAEAFDAAAALAARFNGADAAAAGSPATATLDADAAAADRLARLEQARAAAMGRPGATGMPQAQVANGHGAARNLDFKQQPEAGAGAWAHHSASVGPNGLPKGHHYQPVPAPAPQAGKDAALPPEQGGSQPRGMRTPPEGLTMKPVVKDRNQASQASHVQSQAQAQAQDDHGMPGAGMPLRTAGSAQAASAQAGFTAQPGSGLGSGSAGIGGIGAVKYTPGKDRTVGVPIAAGEGQDFEAALRAAAAAGARAQAQAGSADKKDEL